MIKPFRDEVVRQIKEAGIGLIDKAGIIIDEGDEKILNVEITIQIQTMSDGIDFPEFKAKTTYANKKIQFDNWEKHGRHSRVTFGVGGGGYSIRVEQDE